MWPTRHAGIPPPLWTEFLKHAYENITLPQTSFAGGNNGLYCTKWVYSHLLFGQLLRGLKSLLMGCVSILRGLKSSRLINDKCE